MPAFRSRYLNLGLSLLAGFAAASLGVTLVVLGAATFFRPDISQIPPMPSEAEASAARAARETPLNPRDPPIIWREAHYKDGARGAWWPKGESPILAELVREGKLPPVAERTGPEPLVLQGVEGVGKYGGTWHRLASSPQDLEGTMHTRYTYASLVRWSPQGYPIVPHLAKSWAVSPDQRVWTFTLRQGLRWSDGHPFTSDDIVFWWEWEKRFFKSKFISGDMLDIMFHRGQVGRMEKVDDLTVRFVFPDPHGIFLEKVASTTEIFRPVHYLKKYHPALGDPQLLARTMQAMNLPSAYAVYTRMKHPLNPEHPRMWPWIYADHKPSAPQSFVRNPYYFAVDTHGNQLPYLDRMMTDVKSKAMLTAAAAGGELSFQDRHVDFEDYTLLSGEAPRRGYKLLHWYNASRALFQLNPNLNRAVDPKNPETAWKHELLNEKSFRQALSLAMQRKEIISAVYNGIGEPAQNSPGPNSPFYNEKQFHSFTAYDPVRANALLNSLGLTLRDREGYRTFRNGKRMTWFLNLTDEFPPDAANLLVDQWARVGVRAIVQVHIRTLWQVEQQALEHDFTLWGGMDEFMPMLQPRYYLPTGESSFFAPMWGGWYKRGGTHENPEAIQSGRTGPPVGHPARRAMELYDLALTAPSAEARIAFFNEILDIAAENVWTINLATPPPHLAVIKDGFRNVPDHVSVGVFLMTPANAGMETYFWDKNNDTPSVAAQIGKSLAEPSMLPRSDPRQVGSRSGSPWGGRLLSWGLWTVTGFSLLLVGLRHPFVWRRLLTLLPTLLITSVIVFSIVQLPPGDFVTSRLAELSLNGGSGAGAEIEDIKRNFYFDDPAWKRYVRWMGMAWFTSFDQADKGLLQGNLGRSMERNQSVNEILGDAILLTLAISAFTILFTWGLALPIGIFSAARPYTVGDYLLTFIGFLGMSVPPFLFAIVLMFVSTEYFNVSVSGLFSVRYAADPAWSWGKFVDLLRHIWVPVVVLGAGSTATMIRVMRANLLDELKKPYVMAARAKGVRPLRLLLRYPVRMALNPFVSSLAGLFPQLVSGGAIVALVLSLPTIGPMLMFSLLNEDTYFAASLLMVLSVLGMIGTLVSDLLLLWLDPRIRLGSGFR